MSNGLFGIVTTESETPSPQLDAIGVISAEDAMADILNISTEVHSDVAIVQNAENIALVTVEQSIANLESMMANPDKVDKQHALLAVENLKIAARVTDGGMPSVSVEDDAMTICSVSLEGAKEFLKKILDAIKAVFNKIINAVKKVFAKLVVAMDGTEKKAKDLTKLLRDNKNEVETGQKFSKKDTASISKMFAAALYLEGKNSIAGADNDFVVKCLPELVTVESVSKELENGTSIVQGLTSTSTPEDVAAKVKEYNEKVLKGNTGVDLTVADAEDKFGYSTPNDAEKVELKSLFTYGGKLKIKELVTPTEDDDKSSVKVKTKFKNIAANLSDIDDEAELNVMSKDDIVTLLSKIQTKAKASKGFKDKVMKFIENQDKAIDKMAKKEQGSYIVNKIIAGEATLMRDAVVNLGLDFIVWYVRGVSRALTYANKHAGEIKGSRM